jgi:hypothetical protein
MVYFIKSLQNLSQLPFLHLRHIRILNAITPRLHKSNAYNRHELIRLHNPHLKRCLLLQHNNRFLLRREQVPSFATAHSRKCSCLRRSETSRRDALPSTRQPALHVSDHQVLVRRSVIHESSLEREK